MGRLDELALVSRAALLGDRYAFGVLAEAYRLPMLRLLHSLCDGDEELSKDLAQEAFIKAWLNIGSFRAAAKFSTWLFRIAYNTFYDHARARKPAVECAASALHLPADAPSPERRMDFVRAMAALKGDEKTATQLFYMEDFSVKKIAQVMSCPEGTVKSLLFRGKEKLSVYFKNSGYDR
ncbi:MAG: sigma-70 family RNA polymerase sigma factor [Prevotellaceae bacterium]|jgi:RNA polymerase sigma-70 factor (ECF subfamily)|nr:sigma-70 family RNA polymerase sigma factor [Prevotellaceae bacterium]